MRVIHGSQANWRALLCTVLLLTGCSRLFDVDGPSNVLDPSTVRTISGATSLYTGTLDDMVLAYGGGNSMSGNYVGISGLFTDEFASMAQNGGPLLDARSVVNWGTSFDNLYLKLQQTRVQAQQAIAVLTPFMPTIPRAFVGHMYAIEGYTEVMLAELYCSGIPLSTVRFDGDIDYAEGSTTNQVLALAIAHFDTAMSFASDSARFETLAAIGKGRALLDLGDDSTAARAVHAVTTDAVYNVEYSTALQGRENILGKYGPSDGGAIGISVADREGGVGVPWITSVDPRVPVRQVVGGYLTTKYSNGGTPIPLASGIEARLIEAEADLRRSGTEWLTILNALRTDGTFSTSPNPSNPALRDTTWHPGSGGIAGLRPLDDPGLPTARINLLFRERGFWLFATGHREGDLRRLVKFYNLDTRIVYPNGAYHLFDGTLAQSVSFYGPAIVIPVPVSEQQLNPKYHGCLNTNA